MTYRIAILRDFNPVYSAHHEYKKFLLDNEASTINGIQQVPTGFNMVVRHKDGTTIEYVEHR